MRKARGVICGICNMGKKKRYDDSDSSDEDAEYRKPRTRNQRKRDKQRAAKGAEADLSGKSAKLVVAK